VGQFDQRCGDNQSVLANMSEPGSTLKKKSQSIAYHFVREGVAKDEWRTSYVNTHDDEADLLTKLLPAGEKRREFMRNLFHHIFAKSLLLLISVFVVNTSTPERRTSFFLPR
jgi:hypothetical protein